MVHTAPKLAIRWLFGLSAAYFCSLLFDSVPLWLSEELLPLQLGVRKGPGNSDISKVVTRSGQTQA